MSAPQWQLWVDGTALPNPGRIGLGVVLSDPTGQRQSQSQAPGQQGCNNSAELQALCLGLRLAAAAGARHLQAYSDSDFVVRHVLGQQQTAVPRLLPLIAAARELLAGFETVELRWLPRHRNGEADLLARAAVGLGAKLSKPPRRKRR